VFVSHFHSVESLIDLHQAGITFEEIGEFSEEVILKIFNKSSPIVQLKIAGIDWRKCINTEYFEVFISEIIALRSLHQEGITVEELSRFSREILMKILKNSAGIAQLKKDGIDWKKCINTECFEVFMSEIIALRSLHQGGITVEELSRFSREILTKILKNNEGIAQLKKAGIDWRAYVNTNWSDAVESNGRLRRSLIDLHQAGITFDRINALPSDIVLKILHSDYLMLNLNRSSINWMEFTKTKCFDIIRSDIELWVSLDLLHKDNISLREIEEFPREIILKILKNSFKIIEWKIGGLDWRKGLGII
jgi:hypothetical protein